MIIESGVIIFCGMLLLALKLPLSISLRALGYPFTVDLSASLIAFCMHYGTFSGVMAAAVAGLMCSGFTSCARYTFGWIEAGEYTPGKLWPIDIKHLNLEN